MKALNVVLSILVLLAAIAAAVFSYFLWERRVALVDGWYKMAAAIEQAAKTMDKNSGTSSAKSLSRESLDHRKLAELDGNLSALTKEAAALCEARDALAAAICEMGQVLELEGIAAQADFMNIAKSGESLAGVKAKTREYKANYDKFADGVIAAAAKAGVTITRAEIKDNPAGVARKLENKIDTMNTRLEAYGKTVAEIAKIAGVKDFDGGSADIDFALRKVLSSVRELNDQLQTLRARAGLSTSDTGSEADRLRRELAQKDAAIRKINKYLGLDENGELPKPLPWDAGSEEARSKVLGKILSINNEFGFASCDLSTKTRVKQQADKIVWDKIDPKIAVGDVLLVARNWDSEDTVGFVARVKVEKIDENGSVLIPLSGGKDIQVGDVVFYPGAKAKK